MHEDNLVNKIGKRRADELAAFQFDSTITKRRRLMYLPYLYQQ